MFISIRKHTDNSIMQYRILQPHCGGQDHAAHTINFKFDFLNQDIA